MKKEYVLFIKGYYYTKDQCWNGDNDITIFNYGAYSIGNAVKEFFADFGKMLEDDGDICNGKQIQYEIDNYIDSCDAELLQCFKKEIFKTNKL